MNDKKLVVVIHGIRDNAGWQQKIESIIGTGDQPDSDIVVAKIEFDWFPVPQFMEPTRYCRNQVLKYAEWTLKGILRKYPGRKLSIIAHSFGTWLTVNTLLRNPNIQVDQLILCGAVVPKQFDWQPLYGNINRIVNECGNFDKYPVMAKTLTWGYGDSGRTGMGTPVTNRHHDSSHSELYFKEEFIRDYWKPLITEGRLVPTSIHAKDANILERFLYTFASVLKWAGWIAIGALLVWLLSYPAHWAYARVTRYSFYYGSTPARLSLTTRNTSDFRDRLLSFNDDKTGHYPLAWLYRLSEYYDGNISKLGGKAHVLTFECELEKSGPGFVAKLPSYRNFQEGTITGVVFRVRDNSFSAHEIKFDANRIGTLTIPDVIAGDRWFGIVFASGTSSPPPTDLTLEIAP